MVQLTAVAFAQDNTAASQTPATSLGAVSIGVQGEVTIGVQGVTESSADFGRYNGMPDSGVGVVAGWNLGIRDAWDSGGTRYYSFTGNNINVGFGEGFAPEAGITLKAGDQGTWSAFVDYDAKTYRASNDFTSILDSKGNLSPGYLSALTSLPTGSGPILSGYVSATAPSYFGSPSAKYYPGGVTVYSGSVGSTAGHPLGAYTYPTPSPGSGYDIFLASKNELTSTVGTRRDKGTIGGNYELGDWTLGAVVSHEHKDGTLEQSMTTAGSNSGFVTFPMPINYDQDTYTVSANYDNDVLQAHFSYEFSNFIDHNKSGYAFEGWNFTEVRTGSASPYTYTGYELSGIYSLPPNNQAHTFSGEVAYNVTSTTRVNGTVVYGLQLQNDPFVSPTLNQYALTNFASTFAQNPTSLNGLVNTWFTNLTVNSRPLPELSLKASYTLDARDPQTKAMSIYGDPTDAITPTTTTYYSGAAGNTCVPSTNKCSIPFARQAVPASWTKQSIALNAEYHVDSSTKISVGYKFTDDERGNALTHHAQENAESAKIFSNFAPNVTASLGYIHADRTASAPNFSFWTQQIAQSDCATLANGSYVNYSNGCQQVPFYEAARTQDAVTGMATDAIDQNASLTVFGKYTNNQYHSPDAVYAPTVAGVGNFPPTPGTPPPGLPSHGVNHDYNISAGPDFNYKFDENLEVHTFYTFLRTYRAIRNLNSQNGSNPGTGTTTVCSGSVACDYYSEASTYDIHTAGIGGTWHANDRLKFIGDYIFSYGSQGFAQSGAWSTQGTQNFGGDPQLNTKSVNNQVKLRAIYDYTSSVSLFLGYQFDSLDESDWALVGKTVGQVLTGNIPPKYNVSTITAAVTLKL